jgi:hypothetical protein
MKLQEVSINQKEGRKEEIEEKTTKSIVDLTLKFWDL